MNNQLYVEWDSNFPLTMVEISQPYSRPAASMTYLLSNYHNSLQLHPRDYCNFQVNQLTIIKISEANSYTGSGESQSTQYSLPKIITFMSVQRSYAIEDPKLKIN